MQHEFHDEDHEEASSLYLVANTCRTGDHGLVSGSVILLQWEDHALAIDLVVVEGTLSWVARSPEWAWQLFVDSQAGGEREWIYHSRAVVESRWPCSQVALADFQSGCLVSCSACRTALWVCCTLVWINATCMSLPCPLPCLWCVLLEECLSGC